MCGESSLCDDIFSWLMEYYKILDNMITEINLCFEKLCVNSDDSKFFSSHSLSVTPVEILNKCTADSEIKYEEDINLKMNNAIDFFFK